MTKVKPHQDDDVGTTCQPLLETESSLMVFLSKPAISTISFFKGDVDLEQSKRWLKERLSAICKANPWLAGRLVKKKKVHKNLLLAMPQSVTGEDVDALICEDADGALSGVGVRTPYEKLCDTLLKSKMVVGPGYKLVGKDLRCSKFTLAKVADGQVALIVSITHAVADGHTYYKVMSMLSGDVEELSSTRKHDFVPQSEEAIGKMESKCLSSLPFALCCIKSLLFGSKAKIDARYVDEDKVKELKADVKSGYISTNDILTSAFSRSVRTDILMMAINLRKRVKEVGESDAGNYSLVVVHDSKSSASPSGIRASLEGPPYTRKGGKPLPGFFKTVNARAGMITNWAFPFFQADVSLCDANGERTIPLDLHLPIPYHPKEIALPIAVIFKPSPGRLGFLYGGSPKMISSKDLIGAGAPIGGQISNEMFPID
ncbi:hypothetical protein ACHAWF_009755 [Thalassiosira exigua]